MKILVLNCGSSSFKYQVIDMETKGVMAKGVYERIATSESVLTHKINSQKYVFENAVKDHSEAIKFVMEKLTDSEIGVIKSLDEITAVGHRVVHGGERFKNSMIVDDEVKKGIEDAIKYAPLHNPGALAGINAAEQELSGKPNVVVFDTAFHQTMPRENYIYPIPYEYYEKHGVRRYGAHGTSHKYISKRAAEILKNDKLKIISCHLGQGASLCAISNGESVDTTMGLTPLGGIAMCARSGDLDPSIVTYLMKQENLTAEEIENILNKKSGMLGICGVSTDNRDVEKACLEGNMQAKLALDIFAHSVAQNIVKLAVSMQGMDVIVFTAGIGENECNTRQRIIDNLKFLGAKIDSKKNEEIHSEEVEISMPESSTKVWVVPTNEELMIANETAELVK